MCVCCCVPIRSAKPPTGRRQVPVTNCSSLILFSLSISFTNCQQFCVNTGQWIQNTLVSMLHQYSPNIIWYQGFLMVLLEDVVPFIYCREQTADRAMHDGCDMSSWRIAWRIPTRPLIFANSSVWLWVSAAVCTNLPEPKNLLATSGIMSVDGVPLPVHKVYLLHPTQHHLKMRGKQHL